jgi:hypothetical protein
LAGKKSTKINGRISKTALLTENARPGLSRAIRAVKPQAWMGGFIEFMECLPVSTGKIRRPMEPGPDGGENEILYMDQAQSRGASRFRGMDRRREVAAHEIHRPAGGQRSALDKSARWTLMF